LSISNYKYNHDWFTRGVLEEKDGLVEKRGSLRKSGLWRKIKGIRTYGPCEYQREYEVKKARISEERRSEEGTNFRVKMKCSDQC
jgi:hypothetical protein